MKRAAVFSSDVKKTGEAEFLDGLSKEYDEHSRKLPEITLLLEGPERTTMKRGIARQALRPLLGPSRVLVIPKQICE